MTLGLVSGVCVWYCSGVYYWQKASRVDEVGQEGAAFPHMGTPPLGCACLLLTRLCCIR